MHAAILPEILCFSQKPGRLCAARAARLVSPRTAVPITLGPTSSCHPTLWELSQGHGAL
jgi:hypothetical protein